MKESPRRQEQPRKAPSGTPPAKPDRAEAEATRQEPQQDAPRKRAAAKKTPAKEAGPGAAVQSETAGAAASTGTKESGAKRPRKSAAPGAGSTEAGGAPEGEAAGAAVAAAEAPAPALPVEGASTTPKGGSARSGAKKAGARPERKGRKKSARFETGDPEVRKKKRARLEKMRRAGIFGVPGRPRRPKRRKTRDELVRPSPPLEQTDPLKHYLAGEMVPCPVGCGGFSEVVRIGTMEGGAGEIWFECLSCAQRRMFEMAAATLEERRGVFAALESGHEPLCPRHTKIVQLRRRGRELVCPECGVPFPEPG